MHRQDGNCGYGYLVSIEGIHMGIKYPETSLVPGGRGGH